MKQYQDVPVLVLGASGFIGCWVARLLSAQNANLHLVVRDTSRAINLFKKYDVHGEVYQQDLLDFHGLYTLIARIQPTIVFNLAGYGIDRSERDAKTAYTINVHLVEALCQAMAVVSSTNWGGQRLIHVGSALEYGEIDGDLNEDSAPNPTTLYGKSKLQGTQTLTKCCRELNIMGMTARLFMVYGPGEHPGRLFPSLLESARNHGALDLTDGEQKRDFTYVEDVAEGLLRLGLVTNSFGDVVNLATGKLTAIRKFIEIASSVLSISDQQLNFGALPTRAEEMEHLPVSVAKLWHMLNWVPSTDIATAVQKTWNFEKTLA